MNNIGKIDRLIRIIAAVVLIVLHYTKVTPTQYGDISLVIAAILAMTSLRKCCPLYALMGFGTCSNSIKNTKSAIKTKKLDI